MRENGKKTGLNSDNNKVMLFRGAPAAQQFKDNKSVI